MFLLCPLCGEGVEVKDDAVFACPHCGGFICREPYGKAYVLRPSEQPASGDEKRALARMEQALTLSDPVKKHERLLRAEQLCPACIPVQEELLHLGRLYERNPRKLDYHVIKCYLLHVFEAPEDSTEEGQQQILHELTAHPRLEKLLTLSPMPEEARRKYVLRLFREYIALFLKGSNEHMKPFMGFQLVRAEKALAGVGARMLRNMERFDLPAPYDTLLPACFLDAFRTEVGSDAWLLAAKKELDA